ncbi:hypothetical protein BCR42DRAFT_425469 [Absidia repens]|uniref:Heterokaryon incompatibility domain-containing protein n=1 Tax=Absidia repens TaxID=90262 RepID=A0A1X2I2W1_9FUNG|nr:hypothetical protein BCR42DRAFT_425469 [Absidia repens]
MNTETDKEFIRPSDQEEDGKQVIKETTDKTDLRIIQGKVTVKTVVMSQSVSVPHNWPVARLYAPNEDDEYMDDNEVVETEINKDGTEVVSTTSTVQFPTIKGEPFGIVLVNIKKAAEERTIHCEKKGLDGETSYVALSYRWGELDEQIVAATDDYHARIVSFQLDDFFKLCEAMQREPDLQHIEYVWVDTLCVDQENVEKRKATIYHMNEIYLRAVAIVAVPDLHAAHISATTSANRDAMNLVKEYGRYLYYLLDKSPGAQQSRDEMDNTWMDSLGIPKLDLYRRDFMNHDNTITTSSQSNDRNDDNPCIIQQMMTLMHKRYSEDKAEHGDQLQYRLMVELQRLEWQRQHLDWQRQLVRRKTEITQSMKFLQSIMEDWSNRTWVISEYLLARRKTGKLKFWYNQLSSPELNGYPFFEYNFDQRKPEPFYIHGLSDDYMYDPLYQHRHEFKNQMVELANEFYDSMRRRISSRTALELILQSKASRNEDRFYSIIPLAPKYKHYIKDRHSVSGLGISDMLSVRLQLLKWLDTKDKLNLLFCAQNPITSKTVALLPTFATQLKTIKPGLLMLIRRYDDSNFDYDNPDCVRLSRDDGDSNLNVLWLCPKGYYIRCPRRSVERSFYDEIGGGRGDATNKFWKDVGLDPAKDALDAVSIPLFMSDDQRCGEYDNDDDDRFDDHHEDDDLYYDGKVRSNLQLVGSWEKNAWIQYRFCSDYKRHKIYPSLACHMDQHPEGFRIY